MINNRNKLLVCLPNGNDLNIDDLRKLLVLGQRQHLQLSAQQLNITAGALSKVLKKIEEDLQTPLFDRMGRQLVLNQQGRKYLKYAQAIVHEYDQMRSEFLGDNSQLNIVISGPAILFESMIERLQSVLPAQGVEFRFNNVFEGEAISQVQSGQSHLAIVTGEAKSDWQSAGFQTVPLHSSKNCLVMSAQHPLATQDNLNVSDVLDYPFVCPTMSAFCGRKRGEGSDGWPDHIHPRFIQYRVDDLHTQLSFIGASQAIGFLPDCLALRNGVIKKDRKVMRDIPIVEEQYFLVYQPSLASGWLMTLVEKIQTL